MNYVKLKLRLPAPVRLAFQLNFTSSFQLYEVGPTHRRRRKTETERMYNIDDAFSEDPCQKLSATVNKWFAKQTHVSPLTEMTMQNFKILLSNLTPRII